MPTTKNVLARYVYLDKLLSDRYHYYDRKTLTEKVNEMLETDGFKKVDKRTIEYDIIDLQDAPFNAPIMEFKKEGKNIVTYRDCTFSIFKKEMTDDEKYLLSEVLSILGQFDGLPDIEGLDRLKKSVNIKHNREIVSFTKNPLKTSTIFGELFNAISHKQVIELYYHKFNNPNEDRPVVLYPYLLKEYSNRWYLFAVKSDGKERLYALDRIIKSVPLPAIEYIEYEGDINERFEDIVGVTLNEDKPVEHVLFWVADETKEWVMTKLIHESQKHYKGKKEAELRKKYPSLQGGAFFSIDCRENYELITDLCYYGKDLLVLESDGIVKGEVVKWIKEMCDGYINLNNYRISNNV